MLHLIKERHLQDQIEVDSAGTAGYHIGDPPDKRSLRAARQRGVELPSRARRFEASDFSKFDYVLAMDDANLQSLKQLARPGERAKVHLLRSFDPGAPAGSSVPDPYYGGDQGFEEVLDQCFSACQGLLDKLEADLQRS